MSCSHTTNIITQRFNIFDREVTITYCTSCSEIVKAIDQNGEPWTMPRTKQEISERLGNVAAGLLEKLAKRLRGPTK